MTRPGKAITLSINQIEREKLEQLALLFGKTWGKKPNISKLIKAIANEQLLIAPNHDWSQKRINALETARKLLIDLGKEDEAFILAQLLMERNEPKRPLRREIEKFMESPQTKLRAKLDQQIKRQHPFQLAYQDASGKVWKFTIRYAEIALHEDRQYLDCWAEESDGNQDIERLQHNWSLRLDRIPDDAELVTLQKSWRSYLDFIDVEFHLKDGLAFGYRTKQDADLENDWDLFSPECRRVVRRVTSSFWFTREILRYGSHCEIMKPQIIRDRMYQELRNMLEPYE